MNKFQIRSIILMATLLAAPSALAQQRMPASKVCEFGRTLLGDCIKQSTAQLIKWAQTAGRVYTQDRISATESIVLPKDDRTYPRHYDFYLLRSGQRGGP